MHISINHLIFVQIEWLRRRGSSRRHPIVIVYAVVARTVEPVLASAFLVSGGRNPRRWCRFIRNLLLIAIDKGAFHVATKVGTYVGHDH